MVDYTYPTTAEVDHFTSLGMNTIRVPFLWERLQQTLNAPFNPVEQGRLVNFVNYVTNTKLAYAVIDPHKYLFPPPAVLNG